MIGAMASFRFANLAAGVLVVGMGIASYWFYDQSIKYADRSLELSRSILTIERSIGYAGFIHYFKKHLLRPGNPSYEGRAQASYQLAVEELARLQTLVDRVGIQVELSELRNTLGLYRHALDGVHKARVSGASLDEIVLQFDVSDEVAAAVLAELQEEIERLLDERRYATVRWGWLSFLIVLVAVASVVMSWINTLYEGQYRCQQQYEYQRQRLAFEKNKRHSNNMEKAVKELERSNRELDGFAYTASHDLKEPLRGIAINANFLAREDVSEKGRARIERMVILTSRMEQLISDILFFSRLGRGDREKEVVDPKSVIDGIEVELSEWLLERGGEIRIAGELPWFYADRSKVKIVLQNLIVNGFKYNDAACKVVEIGFQAEVELDGEVLRNVYSVRDNGIGIAESNHEKVFRIFSRLNHDQEYGSGTGAGLSFVRRIVEDYGFQIQFTSQVNEGTTFYFSLPRMDSTPSP